MYLLDYIYKYHRATFDVLENREVFTQFSYSPTRELCVLDDHLAVEDMDRMVFELAEHGIHLIVTNLVVPRGRYTRADLFYVVTNLSMMRTSSITSVDNEWLFRVNGELVDFRPTRTVLVRNADLDLVIL